MIFLLLPAYNEADGIVELLREIDAVRPRLPSRLQCVVIDDGSLDGTVELVKPFASTEECVLVQHDSNRGLTQALQTGVRYAVEHGGPGDLVAAMDADLTHDPIYLLELTARIQDNADVVVASRFVDGGEEIGVSQARHILSAGASLTYRLLAPWVKVKDYSCGYRLMRWEILDRAIQRWGDRLLEAPGFACTGELLVKLATLSAPERITEIPFTLRYDAKRSQSKMPALQTIFGTISMLLKARKIPHTAENPSE